MRPFFTALVTLDAQSHKVAWGEHERGGYAPLVYFDLFAPQARCQQKEDTLSCVLFLLVGEMRLELTAAQRRKAPRPAERPTN